MSYKIGQFKRTDIAPENFCPVAIENLTFSNIKATHLADTKTDAYYYYVAPSKNESFKAGAIYILDFEIFKYAKTNSDKTWAEDFQRVIFKCYKDSYQSHYQNLKVFNIAPYSSADIYKNRLAFIPQWNHYTGILIDPNFTSIPIDDYGGIAVKYNTKNTKLSTLTDLFTVPGTPFHDPSKKILKIGVQGPEGMLIIVNGEPIRLGKSGMYISQEDMIITSLGVVIDKIQNTEDDIVANDEYQFFTIDYIYEEEDGN